MRITAARISLILLAVYMLTAWIPAALWYLLCAALAGRPVGEAWRTTAERAADIGDDWLAVFNNPAAPDEVSGI